MYICPSVHSPIYACRGRIKTCPAARTDSTHAPMRTRPPYVTLSAAPPVGEGHDPPGSAQKQTAPCFGELEPNSLRIRPNLSVNSGTYRREGHDPPLHFEKSSARLNRYFPYTGLNDTSCHPERGEGSQADKRTKIRQNFLLQSPKNCAILNTLDAPGYLRR